MSWFFSKKKDNNDESKLEQQQINENMDDSIDDQLSDLQYLLTHGKILSEEDNRILLEIDVEAFVNVVSPFSYNRDIIKSHKNKLMDVLEKQNKNNQPIEFYGLFEAFMTGSESLFLINGHHRYYALKEFINNHQNDNYEAKKIKLEIFVFDDLENVNIEEDERIIDLYEAINNSKELKPTDLPVQIIYGAIKLLNEKYPNCIKSGGNTKRPYMNKKEFYDMLKAKNVISKYNTADKLFKKLVRINEENSTKTLKDFFPKINLSREKEYKKAKETGFYLGLLELDEIIEDFNE